MKLLAFYVSDQLVNRLPVRLGIWRDGQSDRIEFNTWFYPQVGLEAAFIRVPELAEDPETQLAILEATIDSWMGDHAAEHGLGSLDRGSWESGLEIMRSLPESTVSDEISVDDLVTDALSS